MRHVDVTGRPVDKSVGLGYWHTLADRFGSRKPAQAPLTITRRLMAILGPIVHAGGSLGTIREPRAKFIAPAANGF